MSRLQLAERIRALLLREIGHEIAIDRLLADPRYARDVLLVCDAYPGGEGAPLAALFREATRTAPVPANPPGHARQATDWSRDTSGFGLSRPPPIGATPAEAPAVERRRGWLPRWREPK